MQDVIDHEYHRARAAAEQVAMRKATSDVARQIHAQLASQHAERAGTPAATAPDQHSTGPMGAGV